MPASFRTIHIHPQAPPKPAWGAPCNGCGVCCAAQPCPLGMLLSRRRQGACSVLRWQRGRYVCGALVAPHEVLAAQSGWLGRWLRPLGLRVLRWGAARWIAAGQGCDCSLEVAVAPSCTMATSTDSTSPP